MTSRPMSDVDGLPAPRGPIVQERFSRQLRSSTHVDHVRAEAALESTDWSGSRRAYGALLTVLLSFYGPAEHRLRLGREWHQLTPPPDVRARERCHLLRSDLVRLGIDADRPVAVSTDVDPLTTGLGWLYVLEGSRLGGAVLARHACAALGDDLPVAFFSSNGRSAGRGWSDLLQCVDAFGSRATPRRRGQVVTSARLAFATFVDCLGAAGMPA
jgi:heme oxygenase (biliverdin-IX-beta and delta-forming)